MNKASFSNRSKRIICLLVLFVFFFNSVGPIPSVHAQDLILPKPGVMIQLSQPMNPPVLKGVTIHPDNPFKFDFILDKGSVLTQGQPLQQEVGKLVKYFLASITTPDNDLWVNLSPYEKNRIIPNSFGQTDMGRDLLAEDYILKQITASLMYPEGETGRKFWKKVYQEAAQKYGTTNISINTFNKVWIVPERAKVYEHGNTAYVVKARLKVMLEEDYLALEKHVDGVIASEGPHAGHAQVASKDLKKNNSIKDSSTASQNDVSDMGSKIVREIIIPKLEKEVNEGENFAVLRQVYYSLILAVWFKKRLKDSILGHQYVDQNKISGINSIRNSSALPQNDVEGVYQLYLKAFKKGVYNFIKEDLDPISGQMIPRKYFSGGAAMNEAMKTTDFAQKMEATEVNDLGNSNYSKVEVNLAEAKAPQVANQNVWHLRDHFMRIMYIRRYLDFFLSDSGKKYLEIFFGMAKKYSAKGLKLENVEDLKNLRAKLESSELAKTLSDEDEMVLTELDEIYTKGFARVFKPEYLLDSEIVNQAFSKEEIAFFRQEGVVKIKFTLFNSFEELITVQTETGKYVFREIKGQIESSLIDQRLKDVALIFPKVKYLNLGKKVLFLIHFVDGRTITDGQEQDKVAAGMKFPSWFQMPDMDGNNFILGHDGKPYYIDRDLLEALVEQPDLNRVATNSAMVSPKETIHRLTVSLMQMIDRRISLKALLDPSEKVYQEKIVALVNSVLNLGLINSNKAQELGVKLFHGADPRLDDAKESNPPIAVLSEIKPAYSLDNQDWSRLGVAGYPAYLKHVIDQLFNLNYDANNPIEILGERQRPSLAAENGITFKSVMENRLKSGVLILMSSSKSYEELKAESLGMPSHNSFSFEGLPANMIEAIFVPEYLYPALSKALPGSWKKKLVKVKGESVPVELSSAQRLGLKTPNWYQAFYTYLRKNNKRRTLMLHGMRLPTIQEVLKSQDKQGQEKSQSQWEELWDHVAYHAIGFGEIFQHGMANVIIRKARMYLKNEKEVTKDDHMETFLDVKSERLDIAIKQKDQYIAEVLSSKTRLNGEKDSPNTTYPKKGVDWPELYDLIAQRITPRMKKHVFSEKYHFLGKDGKMKEYVQKIDGAEIFGGFVVYHANDLLVPDILDLLGRLWVDIHNPSKSMDERKRALAEYEWWFFQANPMGRGGAAMGDAMSFIAQIALGIKLRDKYIHQDYEALTMTKDEYINARVKEFKTEAMLQSATASAAMKVDEEFKIRLNNFFLYVIEMGKARGMDTSQVSQFMKMANLNSANALAFWRRAVKESLYNFTRREFYTSEETFAPDGWQAMEEFLSVDDLKLYGITNSWKSRGNYIKGKAAILRASLNMVINKRSIARLDELFTRGLIKGYYKISDPDSKRMRADSITIFFYEAPNKELEGMIKAIVDEYYRKLPNQGMYGEFISNGFYMNPIIQKKHLDKLVKEMSSIDKDLGEEIKTIVLVSDDLLTPAQFYNLQMGLKYLGIDLEYDAVHGFKISKKTKYDQAYPFISSPIGVGQTKNFEIELWDGRKAIFEFARENNGKLRITKLSSGLRYPFGEIIVDQPKNLTSTNLRVRCVLRSSGAIEIYGTEKAIEVKENKAMIAKRDLVELLVKEAGANRMIGLSIGLAMKGYDLESALENYDQELGVWVIPDDVVGVFGAFGGMPNGRGFNIAGHIGLPAVTVSLIKAGNKEALYKLRHEQAHNKYREAHPNLSYQSVEQNLVDEIYAHLDGFISTFGRDELFGNKFTARQGGQSDWFATTLNLLIKDYLGAKVTDRELITKKLGYAISVIKLCFQSHQDDKIMSYIKQSVSLDEILGILPMEHKQWLIDGGVEPADHVAIRDRWSKFKAANAAMKVLPLVIGKQSIPFASFEEVMRQLPKEAPRVQQYWEISRLPDLKDLKHLVDIPYEIGIVFTEDHRWIIYTGTKDELPAGILLPMFQAGRILIDIHTHPKSMKKSEYAAGDPRNPSTLDLSFYSKNGNKSFHLSEYGITFTSRPVNNPYSGKPQYLELGNNDLLFWIKEKHPELGITSILELSELAKSPEVYDEYLKALGVKKEFLPWDASRLINRKLNLIINNTQHPLSRIYGRNLSARVQMNIALRVRYEQILSSGFSRVEWIEEDIKKLYDLAGQEAGGSPSLEQFASKARYDLAKAKELIDTYNFSHPENQRLVLSNNAQSNVQRHNNKSQLGGIDLTSKRMNLEVQSDKGQISQRLDLRAFENIEIDGLYIKDIEIRPLKSIQQLLGV